MAEAEHRALIERFYEAFDRKDGGIMASCYRADARFRDPAFGELTGEQAGRMWRMLTGRAKDLSVELHEHDADGERGSAHWVARYTFGATGRPVVNDVRASFRFEDGLFAEHVDEFSFFRWSRQALGPVAFAIGWNPIGPRSVQRRARADLERFEG